MTGEKLVANSIGLLALLCGIGSLLLFILFPLGSLGVVRMARPESAALWWDALLSVGFFLQHSGMVRRSFRARAYGAIPSRYHRALYTIASGAALTAVTLLWQPTEHHLLVLRGALRWGTGILAVCAIGIFVWGALALRNLDLFGNRAIQAGARGIPEQAPVFVVRGPYRWVRHPWYLAAILLFWSCADITSDRLLFNVLWTGWICLGARLEEADLVQEFGMQYEKYRRQVPMLFPVAHALVRAASTLVSMPGEPRK